MNLLTCMNFQNKHLDALYPLCCKAHVGLGQLSICFAMAAGDVYVGLPTVQSSQAPPNTAPYAATLHYRQSPPAFMFWHVPLHSGVVFPLF